MNSERASAVSCGLSLDLSSDSNVPAWTNSLPASRHASIRAFTGVPSEAAFLILSASLSSLKSSSSTVALSKDGEACRLPVVICQEYFAPQGMSFWLQGSYRHSETFPAFQERPFFDPPTRSISRSRDIAQLQSFPRGIGLTSNRPLALVVWHELRTMIFQLGFRSAGR